MKRLVRVLAITGGVFLLLLVTRTRGTAQSSDGSCCAVSNELTTDNLPCGNCTLGPNGNTDYLSCSYSADATIADSCTSPNTGPQSIFTGYNMPCYTVWTFCRTGDSCPTSFTNYFWADDPANCTPLPPGCGTKGMSCSDPGNPCCSAYTCVGGKCQSGGGGGCGGCGGDECGGAGSCEGCVQDNEAC
jgi:hypothetical protein